MTSARALAPGLALCLAIALCGLALEAAEVALTGRAWVEALVLALLIGVVVAAAVDIPARFTPGVQFAAREVLELAVVLIGVAIDTALLRSVGLRLVIGVGAIVIASLALTYAIGRAAGLRPRLAVLIAAGNSICGNSAIAAVAPVIGAEAEDVATAISFTAVLGIVVVLLLPLLVPVLGLSDARYGVVAGLTVYAVPQVLAATLPVSAAAGAMATLVKLMRVMLLGPLVIAMGLVSRRRTSATRGQLVPWFIIGFVLFAALRSTGVLPPGVVDGIRQTATWLTILAMAGLGLGVDLAALRRSSGRVVGVVVTSLAVLAVLGILLSGWVAS